MSYSVEYLPDDDNRVVVLVNSCAANMWPVLQAIAAGTPLDPWRRQCWASSVPGGVPVGAAPEAMTDRPVKSTGAGLRLSVGQCHRGDLALVEPVDRCLGPVL